MSLSFAQSSKRFWAVDCRQRAEEGFKDHVQSLLEQSREHQRVQFSKELLIKDASVSWWYPASIRTVFVAAARIHADCLQTMLLSESLNDITFSTRNLVVA